MQRDPRHVAVTSAAELRQILGEPTAHVAAKDRPALDAIHVEWLASSPFCLVATSGADGTCDVSPKGDRPGFTVVLDETTIAIPERPGNKQIFFHCSKAFLRSALWEPSSWTPDAVPPQAQIAHRERPEERIEDLERYYGPDYGKDLYGAP